MKILVVRDEIYMHACTVHEGSIADYLGHGEFVLEVNNDTP
jgi:hypothetical protein